MKDIYNIQGLLGVAGYDIYATRNQAKIIGVPVIIYNAKIVEVKIRDRDREDSDRVEFNAIELNDTKKIHYVASYANAVVDLLRKAIQSGYCTSERPILAVLHRDRRSYYLDEIDDHTMSQIPAEYSVHNSAPSAALLKEREEKLRADKVYMGFADFKLDPNFKIHADNEYDEDDDSRRRG